MNALTLTNRPDDFMPKVFRRLFQEEKKTKGNDVLVKETSHDSISRSFSLPHEVDRKGVEARPMQAT